MSPAKKDRNKGGLAPRPRKCAPLSWLSSEAKDYMFGLKEQESAFLVPFGHRGRNHSNRKGQERACEQGEVV